MFGAGINTLWFDLLNESDKAILATLSSQEIAAMMHTSLLSKITVTPVHKGKLMMMPSSYKYIDCGSTPHSADLKVLNNGRTIYVELKNYANAVPTAELNKFHKDITTKADIFAGLFVGWNEDKFYYKSGIPVLLMKSKEMIDIGLDILYAIEPRKKIDKLCEAMEDVVKMLHTLDKMSTDFNRSRDEMRNSLIAFTQRCNDIPVEHKDIKRILRNMDCDLINNNLHYDFVMKLIGNLQDLDREVKQQSCLVPKALLETKEGKALAKHNANSTNTSIGVSQPNICGKLLTIANLSFKLLKTKTVVTISKKEGDMVFTTTMDLQMGNMELIESSIIGDFQ